MDKLVKYRQYIKGILEEFSRIKPANGEIESELIFDDKNDRYLLMHIGWLGGQRIHSTVFHLDIIDEQIWIQCNNTELILKQELVSLGVPEKDIVIGIQPPSVRKMLALENVA